ncbi:MAG: WhiB family transcriptional regulator [Candidatus Saccharimonas sp.]
MNWLWFARFATDVKIYIMPTPKNSNRPFQRAITNSTLENSLGGEWQARAACSPSTAELFFPLGNYRGGRQEERVRRAKKICRNCPVVLKCLKHALSNNLNETDDGIWGGMTPSERRELNNQNNQ